MKITAETADEQILANVRKLKEHMALLATGPSVSAEEFVTQAIRISYAEGEAAARVMYRDALMRVDEERGKKYLLTQVLNGADDTWSGRGNDGRRARYDGFRQAVREIVGMW